MKTKIIIPTGWKEISVGNIFTFVKSYAFSRENLSGGIFLTNGIGNIHYGDIHSTFTSPSIDLNVIKVPVINDPSFNPKKEDLLMDGDLIIADASEDYAGIGISVSVHGIKDKKVVGGLHTFVLRDKKGLTDEYFRQYIFKSPIVRNKLQKLANGVSVYGISKTVLSKMTIFLPPLTEQEKIVEVIETWDSYLEKLTQVIKLKKKIKKGLMQKLLTGKAFLNNKSLNKKTRYFTIPKHWQIVPIGEVANEVSKKNKEDMNFPVLSCTKHAGLVDSLKFFKKQIFSKKLDTYKVVNREQFVYATNHIEEGSIGLQNLYDAGLVSPMYTVFKTNMGKILNNYLFPLLKTELFRHIFKAKTSSSVNRRGSLRWKSFSKIEIPLPPIEEQKEIADILAIADQEIQAFEKKKALIEQQKKFLINNMITGKLRLPEFTKVSN